MSGHSKWAKIKRAKGANDAKRGAMFTKIGNQITIAAKSGGGDLSSNFILRLAVDKAKAINMPKDNIDKAIKRGTGEGKDSVVFENTSYEGFIAGDIQFVIDCLTDNKNRTSAEIKKLIENNGGTMGAMNSVSWQFEEKGRVRIYLARVEKSTKFGGLDKLVRVEDKDSVMMELMEVSGVEDVWDYELSFEGTDEMEHDGNTDYLAFDIITDRNNLATLTKDIEKLGYKIESAELIKVCKSPIEVNDEKRGEKLQNFIESVEENEDVQNIWTNVA